MRVKEAPKKFHFLGICGTAMGSMAAALGERGFIVSGSDEKVYPPMSTFLEKKGIVLREGYRAENIPEDVDVVVIGNAMKRGNPEVEAVLNQKLFYLSLPEVLTTSIVRPIIRFRNTPTTSSGTSWTYAIPKACRILPSSAKAGARSWLTIRCW
jgi:UDP-N-acetylmuramate-alanine ligase